MAALDNVKLIEDYLLNYEDSKKEKAVLTVLNIKEPELDFLGSGDDTIMQLFHEGIDMCEHMGSRASLRLGRWRM